MMKKSVAIIGAGPAGLSSAKVLLQTQQFEVAIFEKNSRVGGIWALDESSNDGYLSAATPTNLSRFQVAFSDLSWSSVPGISNQHGPPMFPKAWQVNRYLETYRQKYIPLDVIHLNTTVVSAQRTSDAWNITTTNTAGQQTKHKYDYLILASGFFAAPRPLEQVVQRIPDTLVDLPGKIIHSAQFRHISDLLPDSNGAQGKTILIIGGSNSAGEAAGVVATQLSDAQHAGNPTLQRRYSGCRIIHVTPRPLYAVPPFLPADEDSRSFVPLDFSFYNLGKRLPGPIIAGAGLASIQLRDMLHESIQSNIGGDQSDLGAPALVPPSPDDVKRGTVQVALTESYPEFVRSGLIKVIRGKVQTLQGNKSSITAQVSEGDETEMLANIGAVIYATGYTPIPALNMLDEATKYALQYDAESMRLPLILGDWQSSTPAVPELALHGFYEGPYWGIMEMQARLTAQRWLGENKIEPRAYEQSEKLLELRAAMQSRQLDVPQYWLGDYGGYMEEIAEALNLQRNDGLLLEREGAVLPARYLSYGDNLQEAELTMADFRETWLACLEGRYVARAVFRALQGDWQITRYIDSNNSTFPSGVLTGKASFHPRFPPKTKPGQEFDLEYLYVETGTFKTTAGFEMNATRRYVYRYSEAQDQLSIWFVKPDSSYEVDYLFHNLVFTSTAVAKAKGANTATADHLCINDMYQTKYILPLKGTSLPTFKIQHSVRGPAKDYISETTFERTKPLVQQ